MARKKRIWMPNYYYHIVCRGNRREPLFHEDKDYQIFLHMLTSVNQTVPFDLASYCLMTNHYHLLLRTNTYPIAKVMSLLNKRYADYFNNKYELTGHVFEKRYFDKFIGDRNGLLQISQYIHLNPVEAGLVTNAASYRWSSYRYYLHTLRHQLLSMGPILDSFSGNEEQKRALYRQYVEKEDLRLEASHLYK